MSLLSSRSHSYYKIIISSMKKVLFRQPIHLNLANKGKLRKLEKHVHQRVCLPQNLLLTPHEIIDPMPMPSRAKHNHHFYMKHPLPMFHINSPEEKSNRRSQSGAFRAIHTAYNQDSLKGFPLRSITAVRPFRRGICANTKITNNTIEIGQLASRRVPNQFLGIQRWRDAADSAQGNRKQQMPSADFQIQNEEFEEFYKYKQPVEVSQAQSATKASQVLSGVRILPFKKYKIRDVRNQSHGNTNRTIDQGSKYEICRF